MIPWTTVQGASVTRPRRDPVDADTLLAAQQIVNDVRTRGDAALREHAERLGDVAPGAPMVIERSTLDAALTRLSDADQGVLTRTATRIRAFADAQRAAMSELSMPIPGGVAEHQVAAVERAGCYAPGGRFPLPSSVLMTAVTARAAGVSSVWVASPKPTDVTLAAAAVAGADQLLAVGGAQAVAALAFGTASVPAVDTLVGPGNRWVTAAKQLVCGHVRIDGLAGPSELLVIADAEADADLVAADLLAQAEHDPDAIPTLVTPSSALVERVEAALTTQLATLPTADIARAALSNGQAVVVSDLEEAVAVSDRLAPEHLAIHTSEPEAVANACQHYGAVFVGHAAAEVLGDYGIGPNHVLPTGGTARSTGGLSVLDFLRVRTRLFLPDPGDAQEAVTDAVALARLEGLEAHARSAERRLR